MSRVVLLVVCAVAVLSCAQSSLGGAGDAARGKLLFAAQCTGCHAMTESHQGPRLQGVYRRTSGTVTGYAYSAALKKAALVWGDATLDKWLTDPDAFLPGNAMDFSVPKEQDRQDLIAYLKQSSSK